MARVHNIATRSNRTEPKAIPMYHVTASLSFNEALMKQLMEERLQEAERSRLRREARRVRRINRRTRNASNRARRLLASAMTLL
jgi:hypothetical protein